MMMVDGEEQRMPIRNNEKEPQPIRMVLAKNLCESLHLYELILYQIGIILNLHAHLHLFGPKFWTKYK